MDNPHLHTDWSNSLDFYVKKNNMVLVLKNYYIRINTPQEFSCTKWNFEKVIPNDCFSNSHIWGFIHRRGTHLEQANKYCHWKVILHKFHYNGSIWIVYPQKNVDRASGSMHCEKILFLGLIWNWHFTSIDWDQNWVTSLNHLIQHNFTQYQIKLLFI